MPSILVCILYIKIDKLLTNLLIMPGVEHSLLLISNGFYESTIMQLGLGIKELIHVPK